MTTIDMVDINGLCVIIYNLVIVKKSVFKNCIICSICTEFTHGLRTSIHCITSIARLRFVNKVVKGISNSY